MTTKNRRNEFEKFLAKQRKKNGDHLLEATIETYMRLTEDIFHDDTLDLPFEKLIIKMNREIHKYQNAILVSAYRKILLFLGYDEADGKKLKVNFNSVSAMKSKRFLQSKILAKKEIINLIDNLVTTREKLIISLLYDTGCRRKELLGMRMKDINFKDREIVILGKGAVRREVYYTESTEKLLLEHINFRKLEKNSDHVLIQFYNKVGNPVKNQDNALFKWTRKVGEDILGRRLHPHMFRHTKACHTADLGATILDIQAILGHADIKTSMIYVEISSYRRKNAFKNFSVDLNDERQKM